MPNFTPATHAIVVKPLMHIVDKIHHIIDSKMSGRAGIMPLFWNGHTRTVAHKDILPVTKRTSQEAYALRLAVDVFINKKLILTNAIMPVLRVKKEASVIVAAHRMSFFGQDESCKKSNQFNEQ